MSYCRCGPKFKFDQAHKVTAPAAWQASEAWYCRQCERISHAVQPEVPVVRGPINASALLHAKVKENGQHFLTWAVDDSQVDTVEFFPWPRRPPMSEAEPLIHKTWELLMSKMPLIMESPSNEPTWCEERQLEAKQQARGIAEVLAIQMKPFMESTDHVVKCAVKAYQDPEFIVPGLGAHLWDSFRNPDGTLRTPTAGVKPPKTKPVARPKVNNKSTKTLSAEEAEGIKEAISTGMFSEEDIAAMFKVSLDTVKQAIKS